MAEKQVRYEFGEEGELVDGGDAETFTFDMADLREEQSEYAHQNQGPTDRCGDFSVVNALNFLGWNDGGMSADDVRRSVSAQRSGQLGSREMLKTDDIWLYFLNMKRFRVVQ